jgi:hypothetical protein
MLREEVDSKYPSYETVDSLIKSLNEQDWFCV